MMDTNSRASDFPIGTRVRVLVNEYDYLYPSDDPLEGKTGTVTRLDDKIIEVYLDDIGGAFGKVFDLGWAFYANELEKIND